MTQSSQTPGLPATITELFNKAKSVAASIRDLAEMRDKAEVSVKVASDSFDSQPDRKSLDALSKAKSELERLAQALPDDAAAIASAKARIFSDPAAWMALSEALQSKSEQFDVAAQIARSDFAESVKTYVLAGGTVPTLIFENRFGGIEADKKRAALEGLISKRDTLTAQGNLCRHIAGGQVPTDGQSFENLAQFLEMTP